MTHYEKIGAAPRDIESRPQSRSSLFDVDHHEALLQAQQLPFQQRTSRRSWFIHAVVILLNITFFIATTLRPVTVARSDRPAPPYSPAESAISYENTAFNFSIFRETKYSGEPTEEKQQAWSSLLNHMNTYVTEDELRKLNRTSVKVPGQGYMAALAVFHQLHCLDYLRQNLYPEHYTIPEEKRTIRQHVSHCIDSLRQAIQCHGDTSMVTYSWREDYERPWPDFQINKQCKNYESLKLWAEARSVTKQREENPYYREELNPNKSAPPGREGGATELMGGTRLNAKLQHDLQFSMSETF